MDSIDPEPIANRVVINIAGLSHRIEKIYRAVASALMASIISASKRMETRAEYSLFWINDPFR
jgi:hypothetical protein